MDNNKYNPTRKIWITLKKMPNWAKIFCIIFMAMIVLYSLMDYPIYFMRMPIQYDINTLKLYKSGENVTVREPNSNYNKIHNIFKPKSAVTNRLEDAIHDRDYVMVKMLLEQGADPKATGHPLFLTGTKDKLVNSKVVYNLDAFQRAQLIGDKKMEVLIKEYMKPWWQFW